MLVYMKHYRSYEDKYEYILPEITIDKNIFSKENIGSLDLQQIIKYIIMIQIN